MNPVLLKDHRNSTDHMMGSFSQAKETPDGLAVSGDLVNSPEARHQRFLIAEGHLKTLSIGGIFHYKEDGRGIFRVDLFEGSLTPVPADPEAIVSVRSIDEDDIKRFKRFSGLETSQE